MDPYLRYDHEILQWINSGEHKTYKNANICIRVRFGLYYKEVHAQFTQALEEMDGSNNISIYADVSSQIERPELEKFIHEICSCSCIREFTFDYLYMDNYVSKSTIARLQSKHRFKELLMSQPILTQSPLSDIRLYDYIAKFIDC